MKLKDLAKKIIKAKNESGRKILLRNVSEKDHLKLALIFKEICYSSWTIKPIEAQSSAKALQTLCKISQQEEIKAYSEWISGISEITRGKLPLVIEKLDNSTRIFTKIGNEHEAAQPQVSKIYALALLGHYEEAVECGKNVLEVFEKFGDELAAGKIENNIGNIFIRRELPQKAKEYFHSAHKRFTKLNNIEQLILSEIGLANASSALDDFRQAEKYYQKTLRHTQRSGMFLRQAEIETNIGKLALFRGKYRKALKFLELSRQKYEKLEMPHQTAIAELEIADAYLELNLAEESFEIYQRITPKLKKFKIQGEQARSREQFGRAAILLDKKATARKELKKAANLYRKENNSIGAAQVKLNVAQFELNEQKYKKALELSEEAETALKHFASKRHILSAQFIKGEALLNLGKIKNAKAIFQQTLSESIAQSQLNIAWACQLSLGRIALRTRQIKQAKKHFKNAIEQIENLRAPLPTEEFRMAFLADKLQPFEELAKIYLFEKKNEQAFKYVESARARTLYETLGTSEKKVSKDKVLQNLHERSELLREELNWFYNRLSRADEKEFSVLQTEAEKRECEIDTVGRQIGALGGNSRINSQKLDFPKLQKQIGAKKALIEYVCFEGEFSAFVVTDKSIEFVSGLASEKEINLWLEKLQFQFGAMRCGLENLGDFVGELTKRTNLCLQKFYDKLIRPLENLVKEKDLVIIPQKSLHYIPFHAMHDGENYLVEKREVVYSQSATVWQFLSKKPSQNLENALLIGFADEHIPLVNNEIKALKKIFKNSKSLLGKQATFAAFAKNAANFDVLHIACHGQFRSDNPMFSSLRLANGFVTVRDICSQELNANLVTLSACETGMNKIMAGDEILGLARGFLSAGASSLVLSLWTVNDKAATELMKSFYTNLKKGKTPAESLKIAQCKFIDREFHPYFWSPFAIIGK